MKKIFLIFVAFIFTESFAQSSTTDKNLSDLYAKIEQAVIKNDSLSIARAYYKIALKYDYLGNPDSSEKYYHNALTIAKKIKSKKAIAVISNSLATSYSDHGLHKKAIKIFSETVQQFLELSDTANAANIMINIASSNVDIGKYQKALEIALDALKLKLSTSDSSNIAAYYQQIGVIFNLVGNKEKWIEYTLLANSLAKKDERYGDFYRRMDILNELGGYYISIKNYTEARSYYDSLLTQSTKHNYVVGIITSLTNLVIILKHEKKYSEALKLSQKALALAEKGENIRKIIYNLIETAQLEITLQQQENAEKKLLRAKNLAHNFNYPSESLLALKILSEINFSKGNYKRAYNYLAEHHTLKDSIKSSDTKKKMAELEIKYQTVKKDKEIALLNNENLLKQNQIDLQNKTVTGLIILGILLITLFVLLYRQAKLSSQNKILDMRNKLLRTQMNPHFLFNALIAIQNYVIKNKRFEASDYISQFATLMRTILESSRQDFILLEKEIELLKNYISLQQLRFENSFQFNLIVDENIEIELLHIPPMLIQPFVENAIEHGLRNYENDDKFLTIKYLLQNNNLLIIVEDNGVGINSATSNKKKNHRSYAMTITNERLTNITKIYKKNIDIEVHDLSKVAEEHGTRVIFTIPLDLLRGNYDKSNNS